MIGAVGLAIDRQRTNAANAFATIGVERNRFLAAPKQIFVQDVEHFEKRRVRRNVAHLIIDELAAGLPILLAPNLEFKIH